MIGRGSGEYLNRCFDKALCRAGRGGVVLIFMTGDLRVTGSNPTILLIPVQVLNSKFAQHSTAFFYNRVPE